MARTDRPLRRAIEAIPIRAKRTNRIADGIVSEMTSGSATLELSGSTVAVT